MTLKAECLYITYFPHTPTYFDIQHWTDGLKTPSVLHILCLQILPHPSVCHYKQKQMTVW